MDPPTFARLVERHLDEHLAEGDRRILEHQVAVDFYHPRTRDRLATLAGGALPMYKSGVAYHAPTRTVKATLRVPDAVAPAVVEALELPDSADLTVTDKRPATTANGEVLALTHCALRLEGASDGELDAVVAAVDRALSV